MAKEPVALPGMVDAYRISGEDFLADPAHYLDWVAGSPSIKRHLLVWNEQRREADLTLHAIDMRPSDPSGRWERKPLIVNTAAFIADPSAVLSILRKGKIRGQIVPENGRAAVSINTGRDAGVTFALSHGREWVESRERAEEDIKAGRGISLDDAMAEFKAEAREQRRETMRQLRKYPVKTSVRLARALPQQVSSTAKYSWWTARLRGQRVAWRVHEAVDPRERRDARLQRKLDTLATKQNFLQ